MDADHVFQFLVELDAAELAIQSRHEARCLALEFDLPWPNDELSVK